MKDVFEFMADLRELQHLYATQDLCYLDFQEKLIKWEESVEEVALMQNEVVESEQV